LRAEGDTVIFFQRGSPTEQLSPEDLRAGLHQALGRLGPRGKVLAIPPDITRFHSHAGLLTEFAWQYYGNNLTDILPAIGTHVAMSDDEIEVMFGKVPRDLFRVHNWKNDLATLGVVPAEYVRTVSEGKVDFSIPMQVDTLIVQGKYDLILSLGQVVPHEVSGMANYNKNLFVGVGGAAGINRTHFLGAAYGMERIMGRADTPVRRVLDYGSRQFAAHLPLVYVLTVVDKNERGELAVRGLFIGDDSECFIQAAELSLKVNFELLEEPLRKVVVYLEPSEFKSTWLGNKSIYRTRMAIADGGELIILAPGISRFGEDSGMDALIRHYGYVGTERVLELVRENTALQESLGAAAHLIHGSSEGRFTITYCPSKLTKAEVEGVGFRYAELGAMLRRYNLKNLRDGFNLTSDGEEFFFIANPALGLWAYRGRFE
jgi:nickel-dependent lactate racemase